MIFNIFSKKAHAKQNFALFERYFKLGLCGVDLPQELNCLIGVKSHHIFLEEKVFGVFVIISSFCGKDKLLNLESLMTKFGFVKDKYNHERYYFKESAVNSNFLANLQKKWDVRYALFSEQIHMLNDVDIDGLKLHLDFLKVICNSNGVRNLAVQNLIDSFNNQKIVDNVSKNLNRVSEACNNQIYNSQESLYDNVLSGKLNNAKVVQFSLPNKSLTD